jgi:hypothetical protein
MRAGLAFVVSMLLTTCSNTPKVPQSAIDDAYCQKFVVRPAEQSISTMQAAMDAVAKAQPGAASRAAADSVRVTGPAILRQDYLNCMSDRGYSATEAAMIGHLTP